ncbi:MAG: amidohydrolase family protein [Novosphingobium sp.]|nr:amidohydrolase family protein [Novosphingobium sp.]
MKHALIALLATAATCAPAIAQTVAVTGGTLAIGDGSAPIENGTVVFRDGRIVAAGASVVIPADATRIDARGKWIAAGIISGPTDLGLVDVGGVEESNDSASDASPFNAAIDISTAINPHSVRIDDERVAGVTRAMTAPSPSASIFAGQGAVIDLGTDPDPVMRPRAFQYVQFGENGRKAGGGSRPAAYLAFRDTLAQVKDYRRSPAAFLAQGKDALLKRSDAEALVAVIEGRTRLLVEVNRASDIRTVLSLLADYPKLRMVLVGASEGWMVAREIAAAGVPVITPGSEDLPSAFETMASTTSNAARLDAAGVVVALTAGGSISGEHVVRQNAGNLVGIASVPGRQGLSWGKAFAAITSRPAQVLGLEAEIGSLQPGRRADVVIWDGDPLELSSAPQAVWIDGVAQPMQSHQTLLRDRFLAPETGVLPRAYKH